MVAAAAAEAAAEAAAAAAVVVLIIMSVTKLVSVLSFPLSFLKRTKLFPTVIP